MSYTMNNIVQLAAQRGASDIHIGLAKPIKCRIDGNIVNLDEKVVTEEQIKEFVIELIGEKYNQITSMGEVDVGFTFPCGIRVRGNVYRENRKLAIAIRIFPDFIPKIEELGLPQCVENIPNMKNGIVIVSGETGSGKSTTLAAILDRINSTRQGHIITLEEPIEYIFDDNKCIVSQREIGVDTLNFASGLRSILREDPDVIMIGEMRDYETVSAALNAAETGHLVLATLHTNSAADTLDRIIGIFPEHAQAQTRMQLSNTLCCVLSQRLLPKKDGTGRVLACEAMMVNNAMRNLIREGKTHQLDTFIGLASNEGSISMDTALKNLVDSNKISLEVAEIHAKNKENLRAQCTLEENSDNRGFFGKRR